MLSQRTGGKETRRELGEGERDAISANLIPEARYILQSKPSFPWHRDRSGNVTASRPHSSQAIAVDVFATIAAMTSRDRILDAWMAALTLPPLGTARIELEEVIPRQLLGEPRGTQVDVLLHGERGLALLECKFTEHDGGSCSQTRPRLLPNGTKAGQCNGKYERQVNPWNEESARCALSAKGVRYWEHVPDVLRVASDADHDPCPFADGRYQWMRNLVAAHALGRQCEKPAAFVVAYVDGPFPMARKVATPAWSEFLHLVTGVVPLKTISFQKLVMLADGVAAEHERATLSQLSEWIRNKARQAERAYGNREV